MWRGHLAVVVEDEWLLDPTLDQANKKKWPRSMRVGPLTVQLAEKFWAEHGSIVVRTNGCSVRFSPHPQQVGLPMPATPGHHTGSRSLIGFFERLKRRVEPMRHFARM